MSPGNKLKWNNRVIIGKEISRASVSEIRKEEEELKQGNIGKTRIVLQRLFVPRLFVNGRQNPFEVSCRHTGLMKFHLVRS